MADEKKKLAQMVNFARAKAKPDDNFLESIGVPPDAIEAMREEIRERIRTSQD